MGPGSAAKPDRDSFLNLGFDLTKENHKKCLDRPYPFVYG